MPLILTAPYFRRISTVLSKFILENFISRSSWVGSRFVDDAFYYIHSGGYVYRNANPASGTWTRLNAAPILPYLRGTFERDSTTKRLFVAGNNGGQENYQIRVSDDEGVTWKTSSLPTGGRWNTIASNGNGIVVAVATTSGTSSAKRVIRSVDGGDSWSDLSGMSAVPFMESVFYSKVHGCFFGRSGNTIAAFYKSINGYTWTTHSVPYPVLDLYEINDILVAKTNSIHGSPIYVSSDAGLSFKMQSLFNYSLKLLYGAGLYLNVTGTDTFYYAKDLAGSWGTGKLPTGFNCSSAIFGNNQFMFHASGNANDMIYKVE